MTHRVHLTGSTTAFLIVVVVATLAVLGYQRHVKAQVCGYVENAHQVSNHRRDVVVRFLNEAAALRSVYSDTHPEAPDSQANRRAAARWRLYAASLSDASLPTTGC